MSEAGPSCAGEDTLRAIDEALKEDLEFAVQTGLDRRGGLGSYDVGDLERAIERIKFELDDVRSARDEDENLLSCRASLRVTLPKLVEDEANEALTMSESGDVRRIANRYKMKRNKGGYAADIEYTVEQTDDGKKVFVDIEDDASSLDFMGEVHAAYVLADEIRDEKIAEDQAKAAELRAEREAEEALNKAGEAALKTARVERKMASDAINAVWVSMPKAAQNELNALHGAWVEQMKATCKAQTAGSDTRPAMREAEELSCQTRMVRSCATTLGRNRPGSRSWSYCRIR